jgi:HSP20 family protein
MLNTLFATDVRQTLDQFRRSVDDMFATVYGYQPEAVSTPENQGRAIFSPPIESAWNENALSLRVVLPGVPENDIRVSVRNHQLVIEGERKVPDTFTGKAYRQLAYGKFHAAVALPAGLDVDHVECRLNSGILEIRVPVSEASKPRQIQIETAGQQKSLCS